VLATARPVVTTFFVAARTIEQWKWMWLVFVHAPLGIKLSTRLWKTRLART